MLVEFLEYLRYEKFDSIEGFCKRYKDHRVLEYPETFPVYVKTFGLDIDPYCTDDRVYDLEIIYSSEIEEFRKNYESTKGKILC